MVVTTILLDTHTWVWSLFQPAMLSPAAQSAITSASTIYVAPCSFHEITAKHRAGKWDEVGGIIARVPQLSRAQGGIVAPYSAEMAMLSGGMDWPHKDPFDRMMAATAMELACPLVSKNAAFDSLIGHSSWMERIW